MIERRCCVCKVHLGDVPDGKPEVRESHGYCPLCFEAYMAKLDKMETRGLRYYEVRGRVKP